MSFNFVNACFEAVGAVLAWRNAYEAWRISPKGVYWPMTAFSALWCAECLPYYLSHDDYGSALFACFRGLGLVAWVVLALRHDRNPGRETSG